MVDDRAALLRGEPPVFPWLLGGGVLAAVRETPLDVVSGRFLSTPCGLAARRAPGPAELERFLSAMLDDRADPVGVELRIVSAGLCRLRDVPGLEVVALGWRGDGGSTNSKVLRKRNALSASSSGLSKRKKNPLV